MSYTQPSPIHQKIPAIISPLEHRGSTFIKVDIPNTAQAKEKIRKIQGRKWSQTHQCWYIPNTFEAIDELKQYFEVETLQPFKQSNKLSPVSNQKKEEANKIVSKTPKEKPINQGFRGSKIKLKKDSDKWIQVFVPYDKKGWIAIVRDIPGRKWNVEGKYWLVPYVKESFKMIWMRIGKEYIDYSFSIATDIPDEYQFKRPTKTAKRQKYSLNEYQQKALVVLEEKLTTEQLGFRTIKIYKSVFRAFIAYYPSTKPSQISRAQIEKYIVFKRQNNISDSQMNQFINALNYFYIHALNQEEKVKDLKRPKKKKKLPNVLSVEEIERLLKSCNNLKHKTILMLVYSGGLRRSEVLNLRLEDIQFERKSIFIKNSKGGKDRYTFLAEVAQKYVTEYLKQYQPRYYFFEGQRGGKYSESSIQKIFDEARKKSKVNRFVTLHGLRHSFATHLVENGVPLHVVQDLLGHNDIKTTEIYLHISNKFRKELKSPLDDLDI